MDRANQTDPPATDQPIYWFVILDQAVEDGDFQAAVAAQRELVRLGVHVAYGRRSRQSQRQEARR